MKQHATTIRVLLLGGSQCLSGCCYSCYWKYFVANPEVLLFLLLLARLSPLLQMLLFLLLKGLYSCCFKVLLFLILQVLLFLLHLAESLPLATYPTNAASHEATIRGVVLHCCLKRTLVLLLLLLATPAAHGAPVASTEGCGAAGAGAFNCCC